MSRPRAYSSRPTLAWNDIPAAKWAMMIPARTTAKNRSPPIIRAISKAAPSTNSNVGEGCARYMKYEEPT
ncbi:hypothetical protein D3C76_1748560 [compost metagenome]